MGNDLVKNGGKLNNRRLNNNYRLNNRRLKYGGHFISKYNGGGYFMDGNNYSNKCGLIAIWDAIILQKPNLLTNPPTGNAITKDEIFRISNRVNAVRGCNDDLSDAELFNVISVINREYGLDLDIAFFNHNESIKHPGINSSARNRLYLVHSGGADGGHYQAIIKDGESLNRAIGLIDVMHRTYSSAGGTGYMVRDITQYIPPILEHIQTFPNPIKLQLYLYQNKIAFATYANDFNKLADRALTSNENIQYAVNYMNKLMEYEPDRIDSTIESGLLTDNDIGTINSLKECQESVVGGPTGAKVLRQAIKSSPESSQLRKNSNRQLTPYQQAIDNLLSSDLKYNSLLTEDIIKISETCPQ
jgi:hypothetical protein